MLRLALPLLILLMAGTAIAAPQRVLSLGLCADWLLAYHAEPRRVAALSQMQHRYPIDWIGPEWPIHDGSLEQIVALRPDLVLAGQYSATQIRQRLLTLGLSVEVLKMPLSLQQVVEYERQFLRALHLPESRATAVPEPLPRPARAQRLLLLGANAIGTGRDTLENEILEHAGWTNYLTEPGYQRLDLERIASDPPDAILWAAPGDRALANNFAEHPALARAIPAARWLSSEFWRWQCPGPWTWELIGQLHQWLD